MQKGLSGNSDHSKILVTGGAGFIGSYLTEELVKQGHHVVVLDTLLRGNKILKSIFDQIEFHKIDVCDSEKVERLCVGVDRIFHLAAILGVDIVADNPVETMETEVRGMLSVANAAIKNNVSKIIYASTSGVYGHHSLEQSVTEDVIIDPRTSYAMAKRYNEIYLAALHEQKNLSCIALRFFNVYGHKQDNRMVIPRFFEQALKGEPISVYGSGEQTRDFTWVEDAVKASILLSEKVTGFEIFNISNEKEETIGTLGHKIVELTASASKITYVNAPAKRYDYEVERRFGSSSKLMKFIGYKPETNLQQGLGMIYEYMKNKS
jgi:UDP-glucose 4-epimerase